MRDRYRRQVSFILATHNRRAVVTKTLGQLCRCGLHSSDYEVIVVDNDSTDGTADAVEGRSDIVIRLRKNAGSCAKADGIQRAGGQYLVFLDDDSYPHPGSVTRMLERFEDEPKLGAVGFGVHLPGGEREGAALPGVFVGCGVGFRAEALRAAGGLDRSFFMQAEEYDLAFRLVGAGWQVRTFDDLHVEHLKTACARKSSRTTYYDARNNLRVVARYLPSPFYEVYRKDWLQRYAWLACRDRHTRSFRSGARAGLLLGAVERRTHRKHRLVASPLEHFFRWKYVRRRMAGLATSGARRIVLADLGKNIFAYWRAAGETGITILAIGDDRFCEPGRRYRGTPVVSEADALALKPDVVVVSNCSAVHGTETYNRLAGQISQPVYHWFSPTDHPVSDQMGSAHGGRQADDNNMRTAVAVHA